jgi:hypothetical protein
VIIVAAMRTLSDSFSVGDKHSEADQPLNIYPTGRAMPHFRNKAGNT